MLEIYLDWNILSDISSGNLNKFSELVSRKISDGQLSTFFTDEHIWEASNVPKDHPRREEFISSSLETIDEFCPQYFERIKGTSNYRWFIASSRDVFEQKGNSINIFQDALIKSLDDVNFSELRDTVNNPQGLTPRHLNNFSTDEVIAEINRVLDSEEVTELYRELVEPPINFSKLLEYSRSTDNFFQGLLHQNLRHTHFLLDSLGFRSDERSNLGFVGSWMDSEHTSHASVCDYFITNDEKLKLKSRVVFDYFCLKTEALSSDEAINRFV
ncbi:MAG TPA: hypothetical protein VF181_09610 [Balneolaceae bacterium]